MSQYYQIANDYGTVSLSPDVKNAIIIVQNCADVLEMTPMEFIEIFQYGFPECPHCN